LLTWAKAAALIIAMLGGVDGVRGVGGDVRGEVRSCSRGRSGGRRAMN